jgi:hypothetical protein
MPHKTQSKRSKSIAESPDTHNKKLRQVHLEIKKMKEEIAK